MTSTDQIQVAVIGVGRMGQHHARTYRKLAGGPAGAQLVAVVDPDAQRRERVADDLGCQAVASVDELLTRYPNVRAATVAVPTRQHLEVAGPLLTRGIACLVEKPLAPTVTEAQELAQLAQRCGATLQVGHSERFNPAVRSLLAMHVRPRFMEVHRVSPMTFRSLDVGVVMDMMIHDLDIVLTLVDSPLTQVEAAGVAVLGSHEDVANARLTFASGCVVNLTASRLALKTERKLRIFSETAYVSLDYQKRSGVVIRKSDNQAALERVRQQVAAGADLSNLDYSDLVSVDELAMDLPPSQQDPLTAELTNFLDAVRRGVEPEVSGAAGCAAIEAAERVVAAIRAHRWEGLEKPAL